ncbi:MAG TPA: BTAD domain-containing putative transcriptional regulator [Gemmatimonadaceae bacterium]|nr:BTAD domain-containing putative transcriptional regulator [Gemmatimonadaceae bacterium]
MALRRAKRVALLGYLAAARPRGFHRRDKIAALFWPELADDRARAALRTTLSRLRADCGVELIRGRGSDEIAVDADLLRCDVAEFDDAIADGRFAAAAALYRGTFLDGVHVDGTGEAFESWVGAERSRLLTAALRALASLADAATARGDIPAALDAARRAAELAPTDEPVARRLIAVHLAAGDRGGAMRAYDDLARHLRQDFDVLPSDETAALLSGARSDDAKLASRPAPPASAVPAAPAAPAAIEPARTAPGAPRVAGAGAAPLLTRQRRTPWYVAAAAVIVIMLGVFVATRPGPANESPPQPIASAQWHRLVVNADARPSPRVHGVVVLDSTSDALILIGGIVSRGESADSSPVLGDVWRLTGLSRHASHTWTRLVPDAGTAPKARWQAFSAYDAAHDRAILHGGALGHSSPCANDTWILDRASGVGGAPRWWEVRTTNVLPPPRAHAQGFYEPRSNRIVTFAGNDCFATYLAEVWVLQFDDATMRSGRWERLLPDSSAGAPARRNADGVAYDPSARRMWVQGGNTGAEHEITELWRLDHADGADGAPSWHPVRCTGAAPALTSQLAAYDTTSGSLILFGGFGASGRPRNDTWMATGLRDGGRQCAWVHVPSGDDAPLPRYSPRGALLPNGSLAVLGGEVEDFAVLDLWLMDRAPRALAARAGATVMRLANR